MNENGFDASMWLNSVRAVPTIGLKFVSTMDTSASLIGRLKPLLLRWQDAFPGIKIGTNKEQVKIERPDGYEIMVSSSSLYCKFYYLSNILERGNEQPVIEFQTPRLRFIDICDKIRVVLAEVLIELAKDGNRKIKLIGVVAEGNLDSSSLPPGFQSYIQHLGKPWNRGILETNGSVLALLNEGGEFIDRCHHVIEKGSDENKVVNFKLDWQRSWTKVEAQSISKLKESIDNAAREALEYFGTFGLGELNYGT